MIEKLQTWQRPLPNNPVVVENMGMDNESLFKKINELVDAVNGILDYAPLEMAMKAEPEPADNSEKANCQENVQTDHYWYKQQERYKAALVLIRNLSGAGMSYQDMCIESREIAKWALDPDYKPLLIGRYSKDDQELFDTLRETKGGDNEKFGQIL